MTIDPIASRSIAPTGSVEFDADFLVTGGGGSVPAPTAGAPALGDSDPLRKGQNMKRGFAALLRSAAHFI
jgi:hypothetical protein